MVYCARLQPTRDSQALADVVALDTFYTPTLAFSSNQSLVHVFAFSTFIATSGTMGKCDVFSLGSPMKWAELSAAGGEWVIVDRRA